MTATNRFLVTVCVLVTFVFAQGPSAVASAPVHTLHPHASNKTTAPAPPVAYTGTHCYVPSRDTDCGNWICNSSNMCVPCVTDDDCYFSFEQCVHGQCEPREIWERDAFRVVGTAVAGVFVCTIGVLAGVGGGGAMTLAYAGFLDMPLSLAVTASLSSIFGQGLLNVPFLAPQRYPGGPRRPLINYPVLTLWYPVVAAGTLLGAHWKNATPTWFRNVMLIAVSFLVSIRVLFQYVNARRQEKAEKGIEAVAAQAAVVLPSNAPNGGISGMPPENLSLIQPSSGGAAAFQSSPFVGRQNSVSFAPGSALIPRNTSYSGIRSNSGLALAFNRSTSNPYGSRLLLSQSFHRRSSAYAGDAEGIFTALDDEADVADKNEDDEGIDEADRLPKYPARYIASLIVTMGLVTLSKWGSRASTCNGTVYWVSLILGFSLIVFIFLAWRAHVWYTRREVLAGRRGAHHEQVPNTIQATLIFPAVSLIAGFASSTVGIGGGTLINPLLIEAGLLPEEASASGGIFTFLIALESTISALVSGSGTLPILWIVYFALVGFLSTVAGRLWLLPYFKRRGSTSVIVFALALSLILTFVAVGTYGGLSFKAMADYGVPYEFNDLCPPTSKSAPKST
jgi:uncharacterized membrane protein YfcA